MKVILVNEHLGLTRTFVIRGWLRGVLSLCLLGAPVVLGHLGYQLSLQNDAAPLDAPVQQAASDEAASGDVALVMESVRHTDRAEADAPVAPAQAAGISAPEYNTLLVVRATPSLLSYRHGRSVDPASYQRRVYS